MDSLERDNTRILEKLQRVEKEFKESTARLGVFHRAGSNSEGPLTRSKSDKLIDPEQNQKKELNFTLIKDRIKGKETEITRILKDSNICSNRTAEKPHPPAIQTNFKTSGIQNNITSFNYPSDQPMSKYPATNTSNNI